MHASVHQSLSLLFLLVAVPPCCVPADELVDVGETSGGGGGAEWLVDGGAALHTSEDATPPGSGWSRAPHPRGLLWERSTPAVGDLRALVVQSPADSGVGAPESGLYLSLAGDDWLSAEVERPWRGDVGPVPLVLVGMEAGSPAWVEMEGDSLELGLVGSPEHGCDPEPGDVRVRELPGMALEVAFSVVPYLALPLDSQVSVALADGARRDLEGDLHGLRPGESLVLEGALRVEATHGAHLVGVEAEVDGKAGLPWVQLQRHEGFWEVDFDHGCERVDPEELIIFLDVERG